MAKFTRDIAFRVEKWACLILSDLEMDSELAYQVIQLSGKVEGVKFINNNRPTNKGLISDLKIASLVI
jgi:hypothetical protein